MLGFAAAGLAIVLAQGSGGAAPAGRQPAQAGAQAKQPSAAERVMTEVVELRKTIGELNDQVTLLRAELARRIQEDATTLDTLRLLLLDERISRLRGEISAAEGRQRAAQARADEIRRRLANIQQELILYGGLNREDSERAIRAALGRELTTAETEARRVAAEIRTLEADLQAAVEDARVIRRRLRGPGAGGAARPAPSGQTPSAPGEQPEEEPQEGEQPDGQEQQDEPGDFPRPVPESQEIKPDARR